MDLEFVKATSRWKWQTHSSPIKCFMHFTVVTEKPAGDTWELNKYIFNINILNGSPPRDICVRSHGFVGRETVTVDNLWPTNLSEQTYVWKPRTTAWIFWLGGASWRRLKCEFFNLVYVDDGIIDTMNEFTS